MAYSYHILIGNKSSPIISYKNDVKCFTYGASDKEDQLCIDALVEGCIFTDDSIIWFQVSWLFPWWSCIHVTTLGNPGRYHVITWHFCTNSIIDMACSEWQPFSIVLEQVRTPSLIRYRTVTNCLPQLLSCFRLGEHPSILKHLQRENFQTHVMILPYLLCT